MDNIQMSSKTSDYYVDESVFEVIRGPCEDIEGLKLRLIDVWEAGEIEKEHERHWEIYDKHDEEWKPLRYVFLNNEVDL